MGKNPKKKRVNLTIRRQVMKYLNRNRKPFTYADMIQELITNDVIIEEEKKEALDVLESLYDEGIITPGIYGENGMPSLYYRLDIDVEIIEILKRNGGRKNTNELIKDLEKHHAFTEDEVKSGLFDLICTKKIVVEDDVVVITR